MSHLGSTRYNLRTPKFFIRRAVYPRLTGYSAPTTVTLRRSGSPFNPRGPTNLSGLPISLRTCEHTDHGEDRIRSQRVHPALERHVLGGHGSRRRRRQPKALERRPDRPLLLRENPLYHSRLFCAKGPPPPHCDQTGVHAGRGSNELLLTSET